MIGGLGSGIECGAVYLRISQRSKTVPPASIACARPLSVREFHMTFAAVSVYAFDGAELGRIRESAEKQ